MFPSSGNAAGRGAAPAAGAPAGGTERPRGAGARSGSSVGVPEGGGAAAAAAHPAGRRCWHARPAAGSKSPPGERGRRPLCRGGRAGAAVPGACPAELRFPHPGEGLRGFSHTWLSRPGPAGAARLPVPLCRWHAGAELPRCATPRAGLSPPCQPGDPWWRWCGGEGRVLPCSSGAGAPCSPRVSEAWLSRLRIQLCCCTFRGIPLSKCHRKVSRCRGTASGRSLPRDSREHGQQASIPPIARGFTPGIAPGVILSFCSYSCAVGAEPSLSMGAFSQRI